MRRQHSLFIEDALNPALTKQTISIVAYAAKHPDPNSVFDLNTRHIRHLDDSSFLRALKCRGYNAVISLEGGAVVGMLGYQVRGDAWHCFAFRVSPGHEHNGVGNGLALFFLRKCQLGGAKRIFLWGGDQRQKLSAEDAACMRAIYARAARNGFGLPFRLSAGREPGELVFAETEAPAE